MATPMMNSKVLAKACRILEELSSPRLVQHQLHKIGLSEDALHGSPVFVPYAMEARLLEAIARELGEANLGAIAGRHHDYRGLGLYADYVLDAPVLGDALRRAVSALPFIQTGSIVGLRDLAEHCVVEFGSGVHSVVGARHIDEGIVFLMINLVRHFKGKEWQPAWCEIPSHPGTIRRTFDDYARIPVIYGARVPGIAIFKQDLTAPNPDPRSARSACLFRDLRPLIPRGIPYSLTLQVREIVHLQLIAGDVSIEAVAEKLGQGTRHLQRGLQVEGTTFRDVVNRERYLRARSLLSETDHSIDDIASALLYGEVNSFRRSFQGWSGMTPTQYRLHLGLH